MFRLAKGSALFKKSVDERSPKNEDYVKTEFRFPHSKTNDSSYARQGRHKIHCDIL